MNYLFDMYLKGYEVLGVSKANFEKEARVRKARDNYRTFIDEYGVYDTIERYFKDGQAAEVFINGQNGAPLMNPMDTLKWKFNKGNYTYLLMRVPTTVLQQQEAQRQATINKLTGVYQQPQMRYQDVLRNLEIKRATPRAQRGKLGGKSKFLPKTMKPPSKEQREGTLEMCREMFKDAPEEPTITIKKKKSK